MKPPTYTDEELQSLLLAVPVLILIVLMAGVAVKLLIAFVHLAIRAYG